MPDTQQKDANLFMFYIGGNAGRSSINVHDIQFVVAESRRRPDRRCVKSGLVMLASYILMTMRELPEQEDVMSICMFTGLSV